jgi:hypothetical protein
MLTWKLVDHLVHDDTEAGATEPTVAPSSKEGVGAAVVDQIIPPGQIILTILLFSHKPTSAISLD